jgi:hypothetical protein
VAKPKDKQPWFKIYPKDWRGDANFRKCSTGVQGYGAGMLCVMRRVRDKAIAANDLQNGEAGGRPPNGPRGTSHRERNDGNGCVQVTLDFTTLWPGGFGEATGDVLPAQLRMQRDVSL